MTEPHKLACVDPKDIEKVWPLVADMIDAGYAAVDEITPPEMREWLSTGKGLLWVSIKDEKIVAVLTTSLTPKRSGLACRMVCCGGAEMDLWKSCQVQIEEYARAEGCVKVIADGRPGWARVLPGFKTVRVSLEKAL
jgi:hypothetical protein